MTTFIRYIKLYTHFVKNCVIRELLFRTHFALSFISRLILFLLFILFYQVIYRNILTLGNWSYNEGLLYLSVFFLIDTIGFMFFIKNFSTFPEYISEGKLDVILTKPVDSQFFVSLRYFSLISFFSIFPPLVLFVRQLLILHISFSLWNTLAFLIFFIAALTIYYSLWFLSNLILFWVNRIDALHEFFVTLWRFMQFPPDIFQNVIRLFFIGVVPILFTVAVPTQALENIFDSKAILGLALASIFTLLISRIVWKIGLRRYQSTG